MIDRKAEYERIGREREEAERESRRIALRDLLRASLQCAGFCVLGLAIMFFAFHVNELLLGRVFFWGGLVVGYAGMSYTILSAYRRGIQRGDW
jgi:hypothetical protein